MRFSPYSWGLEAIQPNVTTALKHDVKDALTEIYHRLLEYVDETALRKGSPITRMMTRFFKNDSVRAKEMRPLGDAIKKHTNLELTKYDIEITEEVNAYFGESWISIFIMMGQPGLGRMISKWVFQDPSEFDDSLKFLADVHKYTNSLDRSVNKFKSNCVIGGVICINSAFFDLLCKDFEGNIDMLVGVILHELGHCMDGLDQSLRLTAASELGEDILDYVDDHVTLANADKLLQGIKSILTTTEISSSLKTKYIQAYNSLVKDPDRTDEWLATVTALYSLIVRYAEGRIGSGFLGKLGLNKDVSDSVLSDDAYRGAERRADKFAANLGAGDGIIAMMAMLSDAAALAEIMGVPKWMAEQNVRAAWEYLKENTAGYDPHGTRMLALLKQRYQMLQRCNLSKHELSIQLNAIRMVEKVVSTVANKEQGYEDSIKFLKAIINFAGRALTLFLNHNRLDQNSLLMNTIRRLSNSSLHADAAAMQLLN